VSFVGCALTIIRQVLVSRSSPVEIEHLSKRFISYARRVRTFEINSRATPKVNGDPDRKIKRQVSPSVVSLWARLGSMALFPQLQRLITGKLLPTEIQTQFIRLPGIVRMTYATLCEMCTR
jgi:hypothetical protein